MFKSSENKTEIEGFLKENTLAYDGENKDVIKGYVIIIVEEGNEFRVQYNAKRYKKSTNGAPAEKSKPFEAIEKLLADNTTSLAKVMKSDPTATFESCKDSLTKVVSIGSLQEYLRINREGALDPIVTVKGVTIYNRTPDKFSPHAFFSVEAYLDGKKFEQDRAGFDTGRLILRTLVPDFFNGVSEIEFIAPTDTVEIDGAEVSLATFIDYSYSVGDTISISGDMVNTRKEVAKAAAPKAYFGRPKEERVVTEFVNERIIVGGEPVPIHQGEEGCFSIADIKEARATREKQITEAMKKNNSSSAPTTPAASNNTGFKKKITF